MRGSGSNSSKTSSKLSASSLSSLQSVNAAPPARALSGFAADTVGWSQQGPGPSGRSVLHTYVLDQIIRMARRTPQWDRSGKRRTTLA